MTGFDMRIRTSELPVVIDVDKTLIGDISVNEREGSIALDYYGNKVYANKIVEHIDLLKSYKARGYEVTVWSANGFQWAKEVVTKLDLMAYVDEVATKPTKYVDDKDANTWMMRVYINEQN
jgi:predicted phosphatase